MKDFELKATDVILEGDCPEDYPIQPKKHSREFLREQAYLRPRTNLFQAVFRVRSVAAYAIHKYFQERSYVYVHTPLITANDGEGAGQIRRQKGRGTHWSDLRPVPAGRGAFPSLPAGAFPPHGGVAGTVRGCHAGDKNGVLPPPG